MKVYIKKPIKKSPESCGGKRGQRGSIKSFSPGGVPKKHSSLFQKMSIQTLMPRTTREARSPLHLCRLASDSTSGKTTKDKPLFLIADTELADWAAVIAKVCHLKAAKSDCRNF